MKGYHFGLFFVIIAVGFLVVSQCRLITKMQKIEVEKTEYDMLVAAVEATVDAAFEGTDHTVTGGSLARAEEVFFQTLAVLSEGGTDRATQEQVRERIPCLAVFEKNGYYLYYNRAGEGYGWSVLLPYQDGNIPEAFYSEAETVLERYHNVNFDSSKKYRMEQATRGVWEQSLTPPCVFAVYASAGNRLQTEDATFLYAASGRSETAYYVTEDNYCHLSGCKSLGKGVIVARYATQKESAEDGAMPCGECMK